MRLHPTKGLAGIKLNKILHKTSGQLKSIPFIVGLSANSSENIDFQPRYLDGKIGKKVGK